MGSLCRGVKVTGESLYVVPDAEPFASLGNTKDHPLAELTAIDGPTPGSLVGLESALASKLSTTLAFVKRALPEGSDVSRPITHTSSCIRRRSLGLDRSSIGEWLLL
jgi:hypothetical protein